MSQLYGFRLESYPRIFDFLKFCGNDQPVKKAAVFETEDLKRFYEEVDLENRYVLVRNCFSSVVYYGGNRVAEIKDLKFGGKFLNFAYLPMIF